MPMQTAEVALTCERANIDGVQTTKADTDGSFERIHGDPLRCGGKCFSSWRWRGRPLSRGSLKCRLGTWGLLASGRSVGKDGLSMKGNEALCCHASRRFHGPTD